MGDGAASHLLHHTLKERHTDIGAQSLEARSDPHRSEERCQLQFSEQFSLFHQWQELVKLKCY